MRPSPLPPSKKPATVHGLIPHRGLWPGAVLGAWAHATTGTLAIWRPPTCTGIAERRAPTVALVAEREFTLDIHRM